ncbi:helix-turn-helix transcriptional regulator [Fibrella sp. HMF5335]|uniref:Helix-turn-helix transcriptional regulator n=1 Tax=Fibrella rubiginis TaxID=2817060 RepID=A0A939GJT4_9BACT|nr:AraC family transcriptional regulator [Fibrella rubiginis]MBO0939631.1 helix-turn-helix transcriptional regulator [Fibrella rubiginis]
MTELRIKNMVCDRCLRTTRRLLEDLGLTIGTVELGRVTVTHWPESVSRKAVEAALHTEGFALIDDPKQALVEQIKALLVKEVHYESVRPAHQNVSDYLSQKLGYDYTYLSHLFSSTEGTTIERYLIAQKVERAKELLQDGQRSIADIAFMLGYSSVPHFTNQFKAVVGQTPGQFKKEPVGRQTIDGV